MSKGIIVVSIILLIICIFLSYKLLFFKKKYNEELKCVAEKEKIIFKAVCNYNLCRDWLLLYNFKRDIGAYLIAKGYKNIAIYGLGEIGQILLQYFQKQNQINVVCAIDENAKYIYADIPVLYPQDNFEKFGEIDVIIVTPTFAFDAIKSRLEKQFFCKIESLQSILLEV